MRSPARRRAAAAVLAVATVAAGRAAWSAAAGRIFARVRGERGGWSEPRRDR